MGAIVRTGGLALDAVAIIARVAGVVAAAIGGAAFALALAGPSVWVFSSDGSGAGVFLTLPIPVRAAHGTATLLGCLTVAAIAFLLAGLAHQVRRDVRFVPALSRSAAALAITLGVGSWLTHAVGSVARWSGVVIPDDVDPATADLSTLPVQWMLTPQTLGPDWAFLGLALVLGVLAYIIRAGERLQRDTEGLV